MTLQITATFNHRLVSTTLTYLAFNEDVSVIKLKALAMCNSIKEWFRRSSLKLILVLLKSWVILLWVKRRRGSDSFVLSIFLRSRLWWAVDWEEIILNQSTSSISRSDTSSIMVKIPYLLLLVWPVPSRVYVEEADHSSGVKVYNLYFSF